MSDDAERSSTERAHPNGHNGNGNGHGPGAVGVAQLAELLAGLGANVGQQVIDRIPVADLDERDPDYIRENLPGAWLLDELLLPRRRARPRTTSPPTARCCWSATTRAAT